MIIKEMINGTEKFKEIVKKCEEIRIINKSHLIGHWYGSSGYSRFPDKSLWAHYKRAFFHTITKGVRYPKKINGHDVWFSGSSLAFESYCYNNTGRESYTDSEVWVFLRDKDLRKFILSMCMENKKRQLGQFLRGFVMLDKMKLQFFESQFNIDVNVKINKPIYYKVYNGFFIDEKCIPKEVVIDDDLHLCIDENSFGRLNNFDDTFPIVEQIPDEILEGLDILKVKMEKEVVTLKKGLDYMGKSLSKEEQDELDAWIVAEAL